MDQPDAPPAQPAPAQPAQPPPADPEQGRPEQPQPEHPEQGRPEQPQPQQPSAAIRRPIHSGEFASAASALVLLVLMFALAWYGVDRPPGKAAGADRATTVDAWNSLTLLRWLMLLTILVAVGSLVLHMTQRSHGVSTDTSGTVTLLATVTALLIAYRVLIDPPSSSSIVDQKLGAYLGMLAAFGVALGGYHTLRTSRTGGAVVSRSPQPERNKTDGQHRV